MSSLLLYTLSCLVLLPSVAVSLMETLYDMPVSNHGARVRIISKLKKLDLQIKSPADLGGLKSAEFAKISNQVCICTADLIILSFLLSNSLLYLILYQIVQTHIVQ